MLKIVAFSGPDGEVVQKLSHDELWIYSADVGCWCQAVRSRYVCRYAQGRAMTLVSLQ